MLTRAVTAGRWARLRSVPRGGVRRKVPTKMATATRLGISANRTVILCTLGLGDCSGRAVDLECANPRKHQGI